MTTQSLPFMQSEAMAFDTDTVPRRTELRLVEVTPPVAATTSPNSRWQEQILRGLSRIGTLSEGWDSYGAKVVSVPRLTQTYDLLNSIMADSTPVPSLVPIANGSVQIEWHTCDLDLEIRLLSATDLAVDFEDLRGIEAPYQGTLSFDLTPLEAIMRALTNRARDGENA